MTEKENWTARLARYPQAVLQQLRYLVVAGGFLLLAGFYPALAKPQAQALALSLLLLAGWDVLISLLAKHGSFKVSLAQQLALDALLLSIIVATVGGATNPAVSYLLVPAALGGLLLSPTACRNLTIWLLVLYSALLFLHWPLPSLAPVHHENSQALINAHVLGMWLTFCISAVAIAWLLNTQVNIAREARAELQRLREQQLRDENVLAVATLAAGAAHELATPLSTLAIGLEELADKQTSDDELALLQQQVARCQTTLQQLAATARQHQAGERERERVIDYLNALQQPWQLLAPDVKLYSQIEQQGPDDVALWPLTLKQALLNLLNNAARESSELTLRCRWDASTLYLSLRDYGAGIDDELARGVSLQESSRGLGMGLLLTHASIEQAGGHLRLTRLAEGGTVATIELPIKWERAL